MREIINGTMQGNNRMLKSADITVASAAEISNIDKADYMTGTTLHVVQGMTFLVLDEPGGNWINIETGAVWAGGE